MVLRLKGRVQRFLALPFEEKIVVLQAAVRLAQVRWLIAHEGMTRFRPALAQTGNDTLSDPTQRVCARKVARLVLAARQLVPGRCTCLHLALTTQQLLVNRGIAASVRIGVRKNDGEFRAHAWVQAGGEVLLGGEECATYCALPALAAEVSA